MTATGTGGNKGEKGVGTPPPPLQKIIVINPGLRFLASTILLDVGVATDHGFVTAGHSLTNFTLEPAVNEYKCTYYHMQDWYKITTFSQN